MLNYLNLLGGKNKDLESESEISVKEKSKVSIEQTYVKLSPIEHVLKKPGMYVGDLDFRSEKQFIYLTDKKDQAHIVQTDINWSPGLYKIVDELIVNAYDQSIRDSTLQMISAEIKPDSFAIFNDGIGIDVIKHPTHQIYVPELIFANLLTSTNYNESEQRITGGTHGLGAKLSAIFSTKFILEVWDAKRKLYYVQTFENNLSKISKPTISKYSDKVVGGVKITIYPDFTKFKTTNFSNDMISLLKRRVVDLIGLCKKDINIWLDGHMIKKSDDFESYLNLLPSEQPWFIGKCVKNPNWAFAIRFNDTKTIEPQTNISWVNGIFTNRGGKHVEYLMDLLLEKFQKIISPEITKKLLNDYITLCLKSSVINPTFNSQTKEELNTPVTKFGFECIIPDSFWSQIKSSELINQLKQVVSLSNQKILSKLDGSKKSKIKNLPKLEDANYAGTKKSLDCVLILTEGDSAKATAISGISAIPNGRNYWGVYPLRGKLLNVREASTAQINGNQEITDIKKILGLKSGTFYNQDNIKELRYGSVMIMTDADEDGSHIKGLIINFFDYFFPSLLEIKDFLKILVTPLVKATRNEQVLGFANLRAYKAWKEKTAGSHLWKIKYYKGLGTSTSKEAGEYFKAIESNTIGVVDTQKQGSNPDVLLAFAKDKVSDRKIWLQNYNPDLILQLEPPTTITIKEFVNRELIHFSNYDNIRSIPSISDGFKPSQRKVLYACIKRNLFNELKVAQLAAAVAEISAYHHGEQSLVSTIINMAQNFVGANNLNLLVPQGQLGTRLMGGKDHSSARYIYTYLENYVNKIFNKVDNELLEYLDDDGMTIEPKYYIPIIPMILVNGAEGIGTGFSTFIPNYNPVDIINWLTNKLEGKTNKNKLIPYYKNFKGKIIKYDDNTWISSGLLTIDEKKNEINIMELPVKLWTNDYKEFLEDLVYEKKDGLFKSYINMSSDMAVHFILKFDSEQFNTINQMLNTVDSDNLSQLYKYLRLNKTIKQSNMNLYNDKYQIKSYKSPEEILDEFYIWRLGFYDKRKDLMMKKLKEEINYLNNQIKFIQLVIESDGKIFKLDDKQMEQFLEKNKIGKVSESYDYLTNMTFKQLAKSNLDKLDSKLKDIKNQVKKLNQLTNKDLWLDDLKDLLMIINKF
jgi:DNA topoisomerase-2